MPQPTAYQRTVDFTERDGDDTNHAGINAELDAAALSVNQIRANLAQIQKDDGTLANNSVWAEHLAPSAFNAVQASLNAATQAASGSAQSALTSALSAQQAATDAAQTISTVQQHAAATLLNAQGAAASATAAQASAGSAATSAANASTSASAASTSATNAANSEGAAAASAASAANSASTATTQAGIATTQAGNASASASAAATSSINAANSASAASTSASNAANSATSAANSASAAAASALSVDAANLVQVTGDQTIGGVKTFSNAPVVPGLNGGQLAGMRNKIINGAFLIWQRGTSINCPAGATTYTADRWIVAPTGAASTVARGGTIGGGFYTLFASGGVGITNLNFQQRIESFNTADLASSTVTVSGWVFQSSGSTMTSATVRIFHPTAQDNYTGTTQNGATYTIPSIPNNTWTQFSCQVSIGAGATNGLALFIDTNASVGAGATVGLGAIQLEVGSVATPFEHRPFGAELVLCQRYYEQVVTTPTPVGNGSPFQHYAYKVSKRATPSLSVVSGNLGGANFDTAGGATSMRCPAGNFPSTANDVVFQASAEL